MPPAPQLTIGRALRLAWGSAFSCWPAFLVAFLAAWVASLALSVVGGLFWLWGAGVNPGALPIGAVGLGILWLAAHLVRALGLGAGTLQATARMRGESPATLLSSTGAIASTAIAWFLFGLLIEWMRGVWNGLSLVTTGFAYLHALLGGSHGLLAAVLLALAAVVALMLAIAVALWLGYAFARAIVRRESFLSALFDSAGALWAEPWRPLMVLVVTALVAFALHLIAGLEPGRLVGPAASRGLWVTGALIAAAFSAFVDTGAVLLRLGAYAAFELDALGQLPPPRPLRAEVILPAEIIVEARPLPGDTGTPG